MPDSFAYLILALYVSVMWVLLYTLRPDLQRRMWYASIPGSLAGALAELWYFQDYWRPPSIMGAGMISPEDFLVGFAVAGVGVAIYDVVFGTHNTRMGPRRMRAFFVILAANLGALLLFSTVLGYNSVLVSEAMFLANTVAIVIRRPDLLRSTLWSGILTTAVILPAYVILFSWLLPGYWDQHWIMDNAFWRSLVLWHIPVTEILWYFSWGCLANALVNVTAGTGKMR